MSVGTEVIHRHEFVIGEHKALAPASYVMRDVSLALVSQTDPDMCTSEKKLCAQTALIVSN